MNKALETAFQNPGSEFRGKPFWAWNGKLEPQEVRRQIRIMKRMGLGGFFMHSRVGLDTPYLQKEWFENVDACINEAKKLKMEAWLYDEDRWPSGAAGGIVTKDKRYRMRKLLVNFHKEPKTFSWVPDMAAAFLVNINNKTVSNVRRLAKKERPKTLLPGQTIMSFTRRIDPERDWYNGQTYLDTMNPEAVKAFIKSTHEAYLKRYGSEFGKAVPGIFTDEPNHGNMLHIPVWQGESSEIFLPWTDKLPSVFQKKYGYDLLDYLPELIYDLEGQPVSRARYHYHDCVTFLFTDSFSRQIGEWCAKHKILYTGHMLCEDTPGSQTDQVGSAMRHYEYMQAPGIDLLTERWRIYDTAKQVSSMARQFGAKWRLTETYGCTGWDFSFAGHKALSDWQVALGINLRCQHLSWYTMLGQAKRDYPAGIFYQSPWWELYPKVEDYFGRVHAAMTRGEEVRDLLVIHPIESTWLHCKADWRKDPAVIELNERLVKLRDSLLCEHIDFDYGEEEVISRHGRVAKGAEGPLFTIKKGVYKAVLVPQMDTIRGTTLAVLRKFREAGGLVVFAGKAPEFVDAQVSGEAKKLAAQCKKAPAFGPETATAVETARRINITDGQGNEAAPVLYLLREDKEAFYLFICNTSVSREQMSPNTLEEVLVRDRKEAFPKILVKGFAGCLGEPLELDPQSGAIYTAKAVAEKEGWRIETSLPVIGSRIFLIPKAAGKSGCPAIRQPSVLRTEKLAQEKWEIRLSEANNLVLDRPSYKIGKGEMSTPEEVLRVDSKVRAALKIKPRSGDMVQPWARVTPKTVRSVPVELNYDFEAESPPSGDLHLAIECPEKFMIRVNGVEIDCDAECGWWVDRSLRKVPVDPGLIRLGSNRITLNLDYEETFPGLEIIYLLGNFGTTTEGTGVIMTRPVSTLKTGDWAEQGLAFYSGSTAYCTTVKKPAANERLFVSVPEYRGVAVRVLVNGKQAGIMAWEPNEVDVTDLLEEGENSLAIEVVGHRRNSHGPHHHVEKWPRWTGPAEYQTKDAQWFEGYNLVPCGLMTAPELVFKNME